MDYTFAHGFETAIDWEKGTLSRISHEGVYLAGGDFPLFSFQLRKRNGNHHVVSSTEMKLSSCRDNRLLYKHPEADVMITFELLKWGFSFRASVYNHTEDVIEWLGLPSVSFSHLLQDEKNGKGRILFPYNEGCVVTSAERRENSGFFIKDTEYPSYGCYAMFPNMLCAQFITYIEDDNGIYIGLHDPDRTLKQIDFRRDDKGGLEMFSHIYTGADYGKNYETDFDVVLRFYHGDEYDALDLYKEWFESNKPEGLLKIDDNPALPKWYHETPVVITYPIRGHYDTDKMDPNGFYPYNNGLPILDKISEELDTNIMSIMMHWEGTAPWAPPYVWPPYGGVEEFTDFITAMHERGNYVGVYCSGFGWTEQSKLIASYNRHEDFVKYGLDRYMCVNSDGSMSSHTCPAQRQGFDICPGTEEGRNLWAQDINILVNSGIDYTQVLDQNHGGCSYFCYSDRHGHPPVPGSWMWKDVLKGIRSLDNPKGTIMGCESGAAEPFISTLLFSDNRYNLNYFMGLPFPVYSYLFHTYLNNFMGNQVCLSVEKSDCSYPLRVAYSFAAGDFLTAIVDDEGDYLYSWGMTDKTEKKDSVAILRNLQAWKKGNGKDYLHKGEMVHPLPVHAEKVGVLCRYDTISMVPGVMTQAYSYQGKTMQFLANYQCKPVHVAFDKEMTVYPDPYSGTSVQAKEYDIPALSAVMIGLK